MNNLVSEYFDFAEVQAIKHIPMYMTDYIKQLDNILVATGENTLLDAGNVSHKQAEEKATTEYRKYQEKTLSPVEKAYLDSIKMLMDKTSKNKKSN